MENQQSSSTASAILEAGKKEFLTFGYEKASLRRIAAEASVTTGAIYGRFSGKEAIFEALTGEVSQTLVDMYTNVHREFAVLSPEKQVEELSGITSHHVLSMINYIYDHFDEFKLLLCCGAPGSAEAFIARLAGVEEQSCFDFVEAVKSLGYQVPELDDTLVHILCRSFFQQLQEFISHDLPRERALSCALFFRAVPACGLGRDTESLSGSRNELLTRFRADGRKTDGMQDS